MKYFSKFILELLAFMQQILLGTARGNNSRIASYIRGILYQTPCMIDTNVYITRKKNFTADTGSALYHACYILNNNGSFLLGRNSHLGPFCYVNAYYGEVHIGEDVAIGPGTKIIAYSNHYQAGKKVTNEKIIKNIFIGNNVFIGANCTILPGTTIHDNVIVGAGSIVKGELDTNSVYAGIPCRKIKNNWYA